MKYRRPRPERTSFSMNMMDNIPGQGTTFFSELQKDPTNKDIK